MNSKVETLRAEKPKFLARAKAKLIRDFRVARSIVLEDRFVLAQAAEEKAREKTGRLQKKLREVINQIAQEDLKEW